MTGLRVWCASMWFCAGWRPVWADIGRGPGVGTPAVRTNGGAAAPAGAVRATRWTLLRRSGGRTRVGGQDLCAGLTHEASRAAAL